MIMKSARIVFPIVTALLLVACGGSQQQAQPAIPSMPAYPDGQPPKSEAKSEPKRDKDEPEIATGNTLTEFQKKRLLGHYSTHDGASGFILDRTGKPFLAKLDGIDKVVELSESYGPYNTKEYRSADKSVWLRIDESGRVVSFQGPKQINGVDVVRDADANRLR
jgi:hypothetical protein